MRWHRILLKTEEQKPALQKKYIMRFLFYIGSTPTFDIEPEKLQQYHFLILLQPKNHSLIITFYVSDEKIRIGSLDLFIGICHIIIVMDRHDLA